MRLSKFRELMREEFGLAYSNVLLNDLTLSKFGDKTAATLIVEGENLRQIWLEICEISDVPKERWHGRNTPKKTS